MRHSLYRWFSVDRLIYRDLLALDRTALANERTLLAYARTALMLLVSGITLVKLFPESLTVVIFAYVSMPVGGLVFAFGVYRYVRIRAAIYPGRGRADDDRLAADSRR